MEGYKEAEKLYEEYENLEKEAYCTILRAIDEEGGKLDLERETEKKCVIHLMEPYNENVRIIILTRDYLGINLQYKRNGEVTEADLRNSDETAVLHIENTHNIIRWLKENRNSEKYEKLCKRYEELNERAYESIRRITDSKGGDINMKNDPDFTCYLDLTGTKESDTKVERLKTERGVIKVFCESVNGRMRKLSLRESEETKGRLTQNLYNIVEWMKDYI